MAAGGTVEPFVNLCSRRRVALSDGKQTANALEGRPSTLLPSHGNSHNNHHLTESRQGLEASKAPATNPRCLTGDRASRSWNFRLSAAFARSSTAPVVLVGTCEYIWLTCRLNFSGSKRVSGYDTEQIERAANTDSTEWWEPAAEQPGCIRRNRPSDRN